MKQLPILTFLIFFSVKVKAQYMTQALQSDLIVITHGGRCVSNMEVKESYGNYTPGLLYKMKVTAVVDPMKPYTTDKFQEYTFGRPPVTDSIVVEKHCCGIFNAGGCYKIAQEELFSNEGRVLMLRKTNKKNQYLLVESFQAEKNTLIYQLDLVKAYIAINDLKDEQERFTKTIDFHVANFARSGNSIFLNAFEPESDFMAYYKKKGLIQDNSIPLTHTQKQLLYETLINPDKYERVSFNFNSINHYFDLTLPEYRDQRNAFYMHLLEDEKFQSDVSDNISEQIQMMELLERELPFEKGGQEVLILIEKIQTTWDRDDRAGTQLLIKKFIESVQ